MTLAEKLKFLVRHIGNDVKNIANSLSDVSVKLSGIQENAATNTSFRVTPSLDLPMTLEIAEGLTAQGTQGPWLLGDIGLPSDAPRIDVIYYNPNFKNINRMVGVESASPTIPQIPLGMLPLALLKLSPEDGGITTESLQDVRPYFTPVPLGIEGGYLNIVDPDGLYRIIVGRQGFDNRVIIKLHDGGNLEIQNSWGGRIATLDSTGNLYLSGKVYEESI